MLLKVARVVLAVGVAFLGAESAMAGMISNGGFESGDFSGWTTIGKTEVTSSSFGSGPVEGNYQALLSTSPVLSATHAEVEGFAGLAAGTLEGLTPDEAIAGSAMKQTFQGTAGDVLSFDWNFFTSESMGSPFNDFAFFSLSDGSGATVISDTEDPTLGASATVFRYETGFNTTSIELTSSGSFTLVFGIVSAGDRSVDSGLAVDNIRFNGGEILHNPEPSSLALLGMGAIALVGYQRRRRAVMRASAN